MRLPMGFHVWRHADLIEDNCQKTLDMAQENVLTAVKFLLAPSG
jgi:hypothetical protein